MMETIILVLLLGVVIILVVRASKSHRQKSSGISDGHKVEKLKESIPSRFRRGLQGVARSVEYKDISDDEVGLDEFLAFRLEIVDKEGNVLELIPVETRAKKIVGRIKEGDTLLVLGKINRHGLLKPKEIYNVSTHLEIRLKGYTFFGTAIGCLMGLLFTASVFGLIGGGVLLFDQDPSYGIMILIASAILMIFSIYSGNKYRGG
ncbi:putative membrane protein [Catalinimonas alkaloidigena]|uniref:hypothetical protein n=1 Tax=Catalinimonas alkaloidigena TaxID=1075417 RepID=UPI002405EFF9|nr:hypothetical protein [Catalinimonas alkaloidigena]MDF9797100.1 putative membrane protein [Catalinimonas alkaloidigena]